MNSIARPWYRHVLDSQTARPLILIVMIFVLWDLDDPPLQDSALPGPHPLGRREMLVAEWPRLLREGLVTA